MKKVIILRGPSGVGKSTYISAELSDHQVTVVSADHFFERTDRDTRLKIYDFDVTKLPEAHASCLQAFLRALMLGHEVIVVDNTNIRRWMYTNYELAAAMAGYEVNIVEILPETIEELVLCAKRNRHGTPAPVVAKMVMDFEHDARAFKASMQKI